MGKGSKHYQLTLYENHKDSVKTFLKKKMTEFERPKDDISKCLKEKKRSTKNPLSGKTIFQSYRYNKDIARMERIC